MLYILGPNVAPKLSTFFTIGFHNILANFPPNLFKQEFLVALTKPGLYKLIISFIILLKLGGFNFNSLFCFFDDHMKAFILHIVLSFKICFYSIVWQFDSVPLL